VRALVLLLATACSHAAAGADESDAAATSHARADASVLEAAAPSEDAEPHEAAPPSEAGPPPVNGCATFVDRTADAGSRVIAWTYTVGTDPARCMTIGVGETVTWDGDLVQHPLIAQGGDAPNPIADASAGVATFPAAGTYGFACSNHPFMTGGVRVVAR
jgi:plastocyanin